MFQAKSRRSISRDADLPCLSRGPLVPFVCKSLLLAIRLASHDMKVDILAIFAHPDDMELAVGGTLLKMKSLGYTTGAIDITQGEMGTRGTTEGRAIEAGDAAKILKLDIRENLGLPDGHVFADDPSR